MNTRIARIVDIANEGHVTFLVGADYYTRDWPTDSDKPQVGNVYEIALEPDFEVKRLLAVPDGTRGEALFQSEESDAMRWRRPDKNGKTRMQVLAERHCIKRAIREYFHDEGFYEIDMPLLVKGTTPEVEIESFELEGRYLQTSTEYPFKRMEIGGFDKMYTLTQNFRKGDYGRYRNQEFTMLEWARVGGSLVDIETDVENFTRAAHAALGGGNVLHYQGYEIDLSGAWDRITVREAVKRYASVDLPDFSVVSLAKAVADVGTINVNAQDKDDPFHLFTLLMEHVERHLGFSKPVFLTQWPIFQTASADNDENQHFAHRSELFIAGVEISDGFPSQTNYQRQLQGFQVQQDRRVVEGKPVVELNQKYLQAMREGFPSGAGEALGFDRLVMVLTNQETVHTTLAFSWDEL